MSGLGEDILYVDIETDRLLEDAGFAKQCTGSRTHSQRWCEYTQAQSKLRVTVAAAVRVVHTKAAANPRIIETVYLAPGFEKQQRASSAEDEFAKQGVTCEQGFSKLLTQMFECDRIVAWNAAFDLGVLQNYIPLKTRQAVLAHWLSKLTDPMVDLAYHTGQYASMQSVATMNAGLLTKTGDGVGAVHLFERQNWKDLTKYCLQDVRVMQQICEAKQLTICVASPWHSATLQRKSRGVTLRSAGQTSASVGTQTASVVNAREASAQFFDFE